MATERERQIIRDQKLAEILEKLELLEALIKELAKPKAKGKK